MKFGGLQKTSLIDYPGKISSVLFTPGCNLRCPFCHNWRLVLDPCGPFLSEEDALKILNSRKKYVDAVVITGGEPTVNVDLPGFLEKLKDAKYSVKLDTNGFFPAVLEKCLVYVDYVALDVKTSPEKYSLLGADSVGNLAQSIDMLKKGEVDYEFRNTVVPGIVEKEDILKIGEMVKGANRFAFQQFVPGDTLDKNVSNLKPYSSEILRGFGDAIKKCVKEVVLRI